MTTAFVIKAVVSIFILSLGALLLWANNVHDKNEESKK